MKKPCLTPLTITHRRQTFRHPLRHPRVVLLARFLLVLYLSPSVQYTEHLSSPVKPLNQTTATLPSSSVSTILTRYILSLWAQNHLQVPATTSHSVTLNALTLTIGCPMNTLAVSLSTTPDLTPQTLVHHPAASCYTNSDHEQITPEVEAELLELAFLLQ